MRIFEWMDELSIKMLFSGQHSEIGLISATFIAVIQLVRLLDPDSGCMGHYYKGPLYWYTAEGHHSPMP